MTEKEKKEICNKCDISYACDYKSMPYCEDFKREITRLENIIANVHPFYVETIAEELIKKGYGKVKDYKKEIKRLKEKIEALLNANSATPFITSSVGDLPINTDGLLKAVDEITRLNRVQAELQELNVKYYNEAKDSKREITKLQNEIIKLKEDREKCINALSDQYSYKTTQDGVFRVFDIVREHAVKEFAKKLKKNTLYFEKYIVTSVGDNNEIQFDFNRNEFIDDLLKEYEVENKGE